LSWFWRRQNRRGSLDVRRLARPSIHPESFPSKASQHPHLPFLATTTRVNLKPSRKQGESSHHRYSSRQWRERGSCPQGRHAWRGSARNGPPPPQSLRASHRRLLLQPRWLRSPCHERSVRVNRCRRWMLLSPRTCLQKNTNPSPKGSSPCTRPSPRELLSCGCSELTLV
jgi:hypothetical protein